MLSMWLDYSKADFNHFLSSRFKSTLTTSIYGLSCGFNVVSSFIILCWKLRQEKTIRSGERNFTISGIKERGWAQMLAGGSWRRQWGQSWWVGTCLLSPDDWWPEISIQTYETIIWQWKKWCWTLYIIHYVLRLLLFFYFLLHQTIYDFAARQHFLLIVYYFCYLCCGPYIPLMFLIFLSFH